MIILDGHCSHVRLAAIYQCFKKGIDIMTISAHSSHQLQPFDVTCFCPFKFYLQDEKSKMIAKNSSWGSRTILKFALAKMVSHALSKALKPSNIISGIRAISIFPVNPFTMNKFFDPSEMYKDIQHDIQNVGASIIQDTDDIDWKFYANATTRTLDMEFQRSFHTWNYRN